MFEEFNCLKKGNYDHEGDVTSVVMTMMIIIVLMTIISKLY